jgi:hypothetical protein
LFEESCSYLEGFCIDKDAQVRQLCYSYTSKPKAALRDRSTPHDGTVLLRIIGSPVRRLEGEYWTQRQTTGTVTLTYRTAEVLDELPADLPAHPMMPGEAATRRGTSQNQRGEPQWTRRSGMRNATPTVGPKL